MVVLSKWLYLLMLSHCVFEVFSVVTNPGNITKTVADKEARFLWNTTSSIDEAKWGLFDGTGVSPFFIKVTIKVQGPQYSDDLNTDAASRFKNRVRFIGNITQGYAWFVLTNLSTNDTNDYAVRIKESGGNFQVFQVKLTVSPAPTKITPTITTKVTSSIASPFPNGTDETTRAGATTSKPPPKPSPLGPGEIAGIVIGVLVVIGIIVGVVVWYVKKKKDKGRGLRIPMSD